MIVRTIKIGTNRPGLDFLAEVKSVDLGLYAKLEDLIERIWDERNPPPKLPRDSCENYGDGLLVLRARGAEKWGRIAYAYGDDHLVVPLDGVFEDQNALPPATIKAWRDRVREHRQGNLETCVAWEMKRR